MKTYPVHIIRCALLFMLIMLVSCADFGDVDWADPHGAAPDSFEYDDPVRAAEAALMHHDIVGARTIYAEALEMSPGDGALAAGLAITDLLLIAEMPEVTDVLIDSLGASTGFNANQFFFAEEGLLYWASRGARWKDDGQYRGIQSLLGDELPWESSRLESLPDFVDPLDQPVEKMVRKLVTFANALKGVDLNLETAVGDDDFVRIFIPGEVFHDSELTLVMGRSELSALRAAIALLRSAIYFVAAYENDWSLEEAFGSWRSSLDLVDPRFVPGYKPRDYSFDLLDRHLLRRISSPERLSASRSSFRHAVKSARDSIRFGLEEVSTTTMKWDQIEVDDARRLDDLLKAVLGATEEPHEIPHTEPALTLDLSPFFEDGRELAEEIPWLIRTELVSGDDTRDGQGKIAWDWNYNERAHRIFWFDGVVHPIPDGDVLSAMTPGDKSLGDYLELLLGEYQERLEDVFFTTR